MIDATSFIFKISNDQWFPSPQQREVVYLQQILPVLFSNLGLSLKLVMISYIVNIYLLYFLIFSVIVFFLKDVYSALLFMIIQICANPVSYFIIAAELIPGCAVMILLLSTLMRIDKFKHKNILYISTFVLLFFTIRSHPLVTICLFSILAILFSAQKLQFSKYKKLYTALAVFLAILLFNKFYYINNYDKSYMSVSIYSILDKIIYPINNIHFLAWTAISGLIIFYISKTRIFTDYKLTGILFAIIISLCFSPLLKVLFEYAQLDINVLSENSKFIVYLFYGKMLFTFCSFYSLFFFLAKRQYKILALYTGIFFIYAILMSTVINFSSISLDDFFPKLNDNYLTLTQDTWGIPLRIIVFSTFFLLIFPHFNYLKYRAYFYAFTVAYTTYTFIIIHEVKAVSTSYIKQTTEIIDYCIQNDISKAIIDVDNLDSNIPLMDHVYHDVLIFSNLNHDSSIHVIYNNEETTDRYEYIKADQLLLEEYNEPVKHSELNKTYYNLQKDRYHKIDFETISE